MLNEKEKQLKKLQDRKDYLISLIEKGTSIMIWESFNEEIRQIKNKMALLNKLDEKEKNIHAIWIGIPPKGEFDNLKLWAKYNSDYKIHIWTDFTHILSHKLGYIISENSEKLNNEIREHDWLLEAKLKDEFYNDYQLKNPESFDENVKHFLLDKEYSSEIEIMNWLKEGKEKIIQEQEDIKKYTTNEVILHDVNEAINEIFPNEEYYFGYLETLEHLNVCAGASDRLRYAILDKFGGVYLDTDISLKFNIDFVKNNQKIIDLISLVQWNKNDSLSEEKINLIMNQMILLEKVDKLNDKNLEEFVKQWQKIYPSDFDINFEMFREIAKEYKHMNLNLEPNMRLFEFPIDTSFKTVCYDEGRGNLVNAFIISKENSKFLQEVMKRIAATDKRIKDLDTYQKLINNTSMIIYHTGPANCCYSLEEVEPNYFYLESKNGPKIASIQTINSYDSSWNGMFRHEYAIKDNKEIKKLFYGKTKNDYLEEEKQYNNQEQNKKLNLYLNEHIREDDFES